ncbi:MAG: aminomethyl transferase family protein [Clostridiales bacterium]|jgi:glycine cleavage system aminomethyltransferase T|nr:aminomethyl transferase family protein [Eubacteriales bacterium]MDH7565481.1 aminomethyl transferase family protein [Clostridiales bacterium]
MIEKAIYNDAFTLLKFGMDYYPQEYTGYQDEILAGKTTAWIGSSLMISPIYDVKGPDALKFFNSICVNDFSTLKDKGIRHAVICNEKGQIMTDGVVFKVAEDTYRTYWLLPVIDYLLQKSGMNVEGINMTGKEYFYQIAGPKSLEILEKACECDLHDIKFATHRLTKICGQDMRVVRLGMAGNLAYEVHGPIEDADLVYNKLWEAGQAFGARKLGMIAYQMNHTEGGFANINMHYPLPWYEDPGLAEYLAPIPFAGAANLNRLLLGSVGDELECRFVTPYDVGWGFLVKFNHEFIGRKALEEIAKNPPRTVVTLEWNADDVAEIYASQFRGKDIQPYERIDAMPHDYNLNFGSTGGRPVYRADKVLADGKMIGISSGRTNSYYYNTTISLAFIDPKYAVEGKELTLIWGTPGTRQKEVRVKVARFPYNDLVRNENTDVETIPHYKG